MKSNATITGDSEERAARIVIVDDHPLLRHGITTLVNAESDLQVCGEANSFHEGVQLINVTNPDVLVLDISLPDVNGIEMIKSIKAAGLSIAIIVLSVHDESEFALRALEAGAKGYLRKADAAGSLLTGIRRVLSGELYISEEFRDQLLNNFLKKPKTQASSPADRLSIRQREVFDLIGRGFTTREIAAHLNMSPKTVETHRGAMKAKLGLRTTGELVRMTLGAAHKKTDESST